MSDKLSRSVPVALTLGMLEAGGGVWSLARGSSKKSEMEAAGRRGFGLSVSLLGSSVAAGARVGCAGGRAGCAGARVRCAGGALGCVRAGVAVAIGTVVSMGTGAGTRVDTTTGTGTFTC